MPDPPSQPPPSRPAMSGLYANLLQSTTSTPSATSSNPTISAAPIVFSHPTTTPTEPPKSAVPSSALRFQPVIHKRPVQNLHKPKPRLPHASGANSTTTTTTSTHKSEAHVAAPKVVSKTKLDDWMDDGNDDVNGFYAGGGKGDRGGRKKKRKKNRDERVPINWDDSYDPGRPNSYEEYREGEEKVREMEEWRETLYRGRRGRMGWGSGGETDSDEEEEEEEGRRGLGAGGARFAPPASYSFAPPPASLSAGSSNPPPQPSEIPDDTSGEDAFARRARMSQQHTVGYSSFAPPQTYHPTPPPPPPSTTSSTISAAPIRYDTAHPPASPSPEPQPQSQPPSNSSLPGQPSFARRLLESQGWTSGSGLGRSGSGITQPLSLVASKGKHSKPGFGKIIDKNKRPIPDPSNVGERSEVVEITGCVDGWKGKMEDGEMMGRVGEVMGKFGRVVQIKIVWDDEGEGGDKDGDGDRGKGTVYVRFAEEMSAGMCVGAFKEGGEGKDVRRREVFEGNETRVRFFDRGRFERGEF